MKLLLILLSTLFIISCGNTSNLSVIYNDESNSGGSDETTNSELPPIPTMIPLTVAINPNSHYTFEPIFGSAPYTYEILSGVGVVDEDTGEFTAPNYYNVTVVKVTDADGLTATSTITIGGSEIFTIGGVGASGVVNTVYHTTDGTSWQTDTFPVAIKGATVSLLDNKIFVMGGYTTADVNTVYSSPSGLTGEWTNSGTLLSTMYYAGSVVLDDIVYLYSSYGTFHKSSTGNVWTAITAAPMARRNLNLIAFDNKIFAIGGFCPDPNLQRNIQYTTDGTSWSSGDAAGKYLPSARYGGAMTVFNGKVWYIGGISNSCGAPIVANNIWNSTDGLTWTDTGSTFPIAFFNAGVTVHNGKIWIIGGATAGSCTTSTAFSKAVYYSSDGLNWTQAADLPQAISEFDAVSFSE